jgi:anti-anti-sigma factor
MLNPSVQVSADNGVFVAEFWDCLRLDPAPVQTLRKEFENHLSRGGRGDLVVDMLGVGFAGSAALGGFVAIQRIARAKGGRMVFCNVDPNVIEVFRVSRLESLYTFLKDRAAAVAVLNEVPDGTLQTGAAVPLAVERAKPPARPALGQSRLRRRPREE